MLDRIWRVIRSNINHWVNKAEDPEKILEQAMLEMQDDLIQLRQAVAQAIATQKRTERQRSQAERSSQEWYRRAQLALNKGDEELAREALTRRQSYLETATGMKEQIDRQAEVVGKLKSDMRKLESRMSQARAKKDLYVARARSAQATAQLNELLGKSNASGILAAFERMEDKVIELEARSEAIGDLDTDDLEKRFASLEGGDVVDDELAALKAKMSDNSPQLPSDRSDTP